MESLSLQIMVAFGFGVVFITAILLLAIRFPHPTLFQYNIFRIILSLASAGIVAVIPGFINLELNSNIGLVIRAGGAIAIFVLVFRYNPAQLGVGSLEKPEKREQAAAICYREKNGEIQFLLVKTTGGRWTFPKGNIEEDEDVWFAAKREAFEEAGAIGDIEHRSVTSYLHLKREWKDNGEDVEIHAFPMVVRETRKPKEKGRNPTWFNASEAEKALAEDRKFKYAEEFRKVIEVAQNHINKLAKQTN